MWTCKNSTLLLRQHPYLVSLSFYLTKPKVLNCLHSSTFQVTGERVRFYFISPLCHQNCFLILIVDSVLLKIQKWVENPFWLLQPCLGTATGKNKKPPLFEFQIKQMRYVNIGEIISQKPNRSRTAFKDKQLSILYSSNAEFHFSRRSYWPHNSWPQCLFNA